jgi:uncharacterized protein (DUF2336 family)
MSQFAAQQQAGNPAPPRQGGLGAAPLDPVPPKGKRGTAIAFRLLKQRLLDNSASVVRAAPLPKPVADPAQSATDPIQAHLQPEIDEHKQPSGERAQSEAAEAPQAAVDVEDPSKIDPVPHKSEDIGEDIEAFDLTGLLDSSRAHSSVEVDLSAFDEPVNGSSLLVGTFSELPDRLDDPLWFGEPLESRPVLPAAAEDHELKPWPAMPPASDSSDHTLQLTLEQPNEPSTELGEQEYPASVEASMPSDQEPDSETAGEESKNLRLLLEPELPSIDEFGVADIGRFLAPSQDAPATSEPIEPETELQSSEGARSAQFRFWEAGREEDSSSEVNRPLVDEPAAGDMDTSASTVDRPSLAPFVEDAENSPDALNAENIPAEPVPEELRLEPIRPPDSRRRAAMLRQASEKPSEEAGEVARSLLEIMSLPGNTTQPQERALAADSLLHLVHRLPVKSLVAMAERLSVMEAPPPLILAELIHDQRIEVAGSLLEKCSAINDHDLIEVIADGHEQSNRMIARRRSLTAVLCDTLIATEDASAILTLVRNPGAMISHEAFYRLNELANKHPSLQAPLATRSDLPAPVAFELFWVLPAELRRYVISRFLTDSSTLDKILKLTMRMDSDPQDTQPVRFSNPQDMERLLTVLLAGKRTETEELLAALLGLQTATAARILSDHQGEPLTVALKAMGATRARFEEVFSALEAAGENHLRPHRSARELQSFFESLSFNMARVLLTYWDWAVMRSGPYATLSG